MLTPLSGQLSPLTRRSSFRLPYDQRVLAMNPITYWKLNDVSGSQITDYSGNGFHGTHNNVTLGGDTFLNGDPAATFNGTNSFGNVFSSGFASAFNGSEGTLVAWMKIPSPPEATQRRALRLFGSTGNEVYLDKPNSSVVRAAFVGSSVSTSKNSSYISNAFIPFVMSWSASSSQFRAFYNGVESGSPATLPTWSGSLSGGVIGASNASGSASWLGSIAHVSVFDYALTPAQVADISQAA